MTRRDHGVLVAAGVVLVATMAALGVLNAPHTRIPVFLLLYAVAFAAYAVAVRTVLRAGACTMAAQWIILAGTILAHAVLIPARPDLSTDIYRYRWEGRVILDGANPFSTPPVDSTLAHLRDADYELVSHPHLATIYPPLAQGVFALAAWIDPDVRTLKTIFSLCNLATVLLLFRLLRRRGRPEAHALIFAWSPLVIVETGHSGHLDGLGVFLLVLALYLWASGRRAWAGLALGGSFCAKYLAAMIVPWLARRREVATLAFMGVVVVLGYVPFLDAGTGLVGSLRAYSANWCFNGPPYIALSGLFEPVLARWLLVGFGLAFTIAAAFRERDLVRYAYLAIGCGLLVTPTVYPWYAAWIVPLLCVFVNRAWIVFTALVMLSYSVWGVYARSGAWMVPTWVLVLEYAPFYALLLAGLARRRAGNEAPA